MHHHLLMTRENTKLTSVTYVTSAAAAKKGHFWLALKLRAGGGMNSERVRTNLGKQPRQVWIPVDKAYVPASNPCEQCNPAEVPVLHVFDPSPYVHHLVHPRYEFRCVRRRGISVRWEQHREEASCSVARFVVGAQLRSGVVQQYPVGRGTLGVSRDRRIRTMWQIQAIGSWRQQARERSFQVRRHQVFS